jgi:hypothetical protein
MECTHGTKLRPRPARRGPGSHPGHDPHGHDDVRRVGELDADVGLVRPERPHRERARRTSCGRPSPPEQARPSPRASPRARQLFVGPASRSARADERAVLHARHVRRVRPRQVGARALGLRQAPERARVDELLAQPVVLLRRSVAPVDRVGLRQRGDLLHPGHELLVLRRGPRSRAWRQAPRMGRGGGRVILSGHGAPRPHFGGFPYRCPVQLSMMSSVPSRSIPHASLLDLEPDLARDLDAGRHQALRRRTLVPSVSLRPGAVRPPRARRRRDPRRGASS